MQVIIEIDERKAIASEVDDLLWEIDHVVRKYEDIAKVIVQRSTF